MCVCVYIYIYIFTLEPVYIEHSQEMKKCSMYASVKCTKVLGTCRSGEIETKLKVLLQNFGLIRGTKFAAYVNSFSVCSIGKLLNTIMMQACLGNN